VRLTCTYSLQDDGSVELLPAPSWKSPNPKPVHLSPGDEALLWLAIARLANAPPEVQVAIVGGQREQDVSSARLVAALSMFARIGCIELDDSFILTTRRNPGDLPPLRKLHLEITHRCNFACRACYLGGSLKRPSEGAVEASAEEWGSVISVAAGLGCQFATVSGGEPFVRRDALVILRSLSDAGIISEINTNASCITSQLARELSQLRLFSVEVTLYGYDDLSANAYTQNGRSYSSPIRGICALRDAEVPFNVKYFATGSSLQKFEDARTELIKIGVEPKLIGQFVHGDIYEGNVRNARDVSVPLAKKPVVQQTDLPCYPSVNALAIEPDGRVRACPKLGLHFGNVFVDGLEEIWSSSRLNKFRDFWPVITRDRGYVQGARRTNLCLATEVLSTPGGLQGFRREWEAFAEETTACHP
jgi:MoaA/NifB/PqqE/SkfB family radical SAM enzyme